MKGFAGRVDYYAYRYYDPITGRWPSRDPIGENGGVSLYGFALNNPVSYIDVKGEFAVAAPVVVVGGGAVVLYGVYHFFVEPELRRIPISPPSPPYPSIPDTRPEPYYPGQEVDRTGDRPLDDSQDYTLDDICKKSEPVKRCRLVDILRGLPLAMEICIYDCNGVEGSISIRAGEKCKFNPRETEVQLTP
jgi:hypothetical protein